MNKPVKSRIEKNGEWMVPWNIRPFPEATKNEFCGIAKAKGKNVPVLLDKVLKEYNREQRSERTREE